MKSEQRGKVGEITELVGHALCLAGEIRKALEAIAQPVQEAEPVGYVDERVVYWLSDRRGKASAQITTNLSAVKCAERPMPLYTAPQPVQEAEPSHQAPKGWKLIGYYHKSVSGDQSEDDFFFADAINGDCPDCHPCYSDESLVVAPSSIYNDAKSVQKSQPLTDEQENAKLYKELAESKLHALNGWQRYEMANSMSNSLQQELSDMKASLGEPVGWLDADIDAIFTASDIDGGLVDGLVPLYAIEAKPSGP